MLRWQRVNDEPWEYAIIQGPHGDEFVKDSDGLCLRRRKVVRMTIQRRLQSLINKSASQILFGSAAVVGGAWHAWGFDVAWVALGIVFIILGFGTRRYAWNMIDMVNLGHFKPTDQVYYPPDD